MEVWQEAVQCALLGTARRAPVFIPSSEPITHLLADMDPTERESTLLRAGGLLANHRRANYQPLRTTQELPPPAEPDERPRAPQSVVEDMLKIVGNTGWIAGMHPSAVTYHTLPAWLYAVEEHGWRIPEENLIAVLECGRKEPDFLQRDLRDALQIPLGRYGQWLVTQNPEWSYALPIGQKASEPEVAPISVEESDMIWYRRTKRERFPLLNRLRRYDPARARDLLESTWEEESATDRADFLNAFATGLSMGDEPFLERALDDKGKTVRTVAKTLLARLPHSRLSLRLWERVKAQIRLQSGVSETLVVERPRSCDKAILRDMLDQKSMYNPDWWFMPAVASVPLWRWAQEWERTPAAIVGALIDCPDSAQWGAALLGAWTTALEQDLDEEWAIALFMAWCEKFPDRMPTTDLWRSLLPRDVFDAGVLRLVAQLDSHSRITEPGFRLLETAKTTWRPPLAQMVMTKLGALNGHPTTLFSIAERMYYFFPSVPVEFQDEFFALWRKFAAENLFAAVHIEGSIALTAFCNEMRQKMDMALQEAELPTV